MMIDARRLNKKIVTLNNCSNIQDKILYSLSLKTEALILNRIVNDYDSCIISIKCHNELRNHDYDLIIPFEKLDKIYSLPSVFLDEFIKLLWSNGYVVSFVGGDLITDVDIYGYNEYGIEFTDSYKTVKEYYKSVALKLTW
jgi:hypothetical protein